MLSASAYSFRQKSRLAISLSWIAGYTNIIAFIMCVQANLPLLSFIPGAFLGAATWVGAGGGGALTRASLMIPLSMVLGALFGFLSEALAKKISGAPARAEA